MCLGGFDMSDPITALSVEDTRAMSAPSSAVVGLSTSSRLR